VKGKLVCTTVSWHLAVAMGVKSQVFRRGLGSGGETPPTSQRRNSTFCADNPGRLIGQRVKGEEGDAGMVALKQIAFEYPQRTA